MARGFVHPRTGSARRFSQPLGGFLADPSSRPCFVPLPSLGYLSLQSLASQRSRTRLRVACSPAVIPAQPARAGATLSPRVSPTPTPSLRPLPTSPRGYERSFSAPSMVGTPPDHPGPHAAGSCPTARITRFEASFPLRSASCVIPASLLAGAAVLSWAFRPSRAFSTRPLDPLADPPHPRSAARTAQDLSRTARDMEDLATPLSGKPGRTTS